MNRYFIRTKEQEAFVEAENFQDAFDEFVKKTPLEQLGTILIGHSEYFIGDDIPEEARAIRVTIPLVRTGIWSEKKARDFNENFMGTRIV